MTVTVTVMLAAQICCTSLFSTSTTHPPACPAPWRRFDRRGSPEYDGEGGRRRSRSPGSRRPQAEYITSFGSGGDQAPGQGQGPRQQQRQEEGPGVRDALPGAADPALEGPHMLPAAAIKLHGVRPEERGRDRYSSISGRVRWSCRVGR